MRVNKCSAFISLTGNPAGNVFLNRQLQPVTGSVRRLLFVGGGSAIRAGAVGDGGVHAGAVCRPSLVVLFVLAAFSVRCWWWCRSCLCRQCWRRSCWCCSSSVVGGAVRAGSVRRSSLVLFMLVPSVLAAFVLVPFIICCWWCRSRCCCHYGSSIM